MLKKDCYVVLNDLGDEHAVLSGGKVPDRVLIVLVVGIWIAGVGLEFHSCLSSFDFMRFLKSAH